MLVDVFRSPCESVASARCVQAFRCKPTVTHHLQRTGRRRVLPGATTIP